MSYLSSKALDPSAAALVFAGKDVLTLTLMRSNGGIIQLLGPNAISLLRDACEEALTAYKGFQGKNGE